VLSYRHAFHAGNFADIIKHLVLANTLHYACQKPAPLFYLDTHAGAGVYRLGSHEANKTGEAAAGVRKLDFPALLASVGAAGSQALSVYQQVINAYMHQGQYPGSPLVAAALLRRTDHLQLYELHSTDYRLLLDNTETDKRIFCQQEDGYHSITALLPPVQKRAVILIDPSYEMKEDYSRAIKTFTAIYQRMPTAQIILWYPVVLRANIDWMIAKLLTSNIRDLWQVELGIEADNDTFGMTASGLLLLNPPWTLAGQLRDCLPLIQKQLAPIAGHWKVNNLVAE